MASVLIFGIREASRLACGYLRRDTGHRVVAYTVTNEFMPKDTMLDGIPVVPFESISERYSPLDHSFIVPMSYRDHNRLRARIYQSVKVLGYPLISYVSPRATVFPGVAIGENTMILEGCVISPQCRIGNNVMAQAGCVIAHDAEIGDHAFLAPGVVISGLVRIEPYVFVGSGSVIRDQLTLGEGSFIAMGSVVREDTLPWVNYDGAPARPWSRGGDGEDSHQAK